MIPRLLFITMFAALPAAADGLLGREFTFQVVTYDDPDRMIYASAVHRAIVGDGPELGLVAEGKADFDLVPVIVDVSGDMVVLDYANAEPQPFYKARFNGYILDFSEGCPQILSARLDPGTTTMPIGNKRIRMEDGRLLVNVSNLSQTRDSRMGIVLSLSECPGS